MTTIYVDKTGNDTTGTGLIGAPYLTISKAWLAAVAGDVISVNTGTYVESTSGIGYFNQSRVFASFVTITTTTGKRDVIVQGADTTHLVIIGVTAFVWWDNIIFEAQGNLVLGCIKFNASAQSNLYWTRCIFRGMSHPSQTNYCVVAPWAASVIDTIVFSSCIAEQMGPHLLIGLSFNSTTTQATNVEVSNCDVAVTYDGVVMKNIGKLKCNNNRIDCYSPLSSLNHGLLIGVDGETGLPTSGQAIGNKIRCAAGHGAVIGAGVDGFLFAHNTVLGGTDASNGQGLVIKECARVRVRRNVVVGGARSTIYLKAANNCVVEKNEAYNLSSAGSALKVFGNPNDGAKSFDNVVRRNDLHSNAGPVMVWGDSNEDGGGNVCDQNIYSITGTGTYGTWRNAACTTRAQIRAAWAGYDNPGNDRNSHLGNTSVINQNKRIIELMTS